ncbi:MAG: DUF3883 domain-containing protein [Solirubrobacteraceae bacterium]
MTGREAIEEAVRRRATHDDSEDVGRTVSLANGERLFGHDYHGRFLIELLQNAADAWAARGDDRERSRVEIAIAEGPVLLVANEGLSFPASVVIKSIGHIGRGTKTEGKAIGHKGIGFKSVLEISATPEIYSGLGAEEPGLAVRFDPREALKTIHYSSPDWAELAAGDIRAADGNELALVPVLQFPIWLDSLPAEVQELADRGFETVIRIPFGEDPGPDPPLDEAQWLATVRGAIDGISDEILVLLGAFEEVVVEDRLQVTRSVIRPAWEETTELSDGMIHEHVVVTRDDGVATRWLMFRRTLPTLEDLAGEIVVGARIGDGPGSPLVAPAEDEPSAPFYLFFPTKIRSGLPLLLHGYFEVNAARTDFYEGATSQNTAILQELARLVRSVIAYLASRGDVDLANFVDLLDEAAGPDDDYARRFRQDALTLLDDVAWVPLEGDSSERALGKPTEALVDEEADIVDKLRRAFPTAYVRESVGLAVPSHRIGPAGNRFLVSRRPPDASSLLDTVERLYRPGGRGPWREGAELNGFRALLDLTRALQGKYGDEADEVLARLRGAEDSVLVPVAAPAGGVDMLSLPDPSEGVAGRASRGIMARTGAPGEQGLVPPASLGLAFVPDGLLSSEGEIANATALGIRQFTVTNVLDRLAAATEHETEDGEQARFLFRLLSRRAAPELSVGDAWRQAREFKPAYFFWCRTSPTVSGTEREQQRRRQSLASVRLPGRDGTWRPAGALALGRDWADWIETARPASPVRDQRCEAYRALGDLSPGDATMLASPERLREVLGEVEIPSDAESEEAIDADEWLHAFLLRLGVWETLPLEGFDDAGQTNRDAFPWSDDPLASKRDESIAGDGWRFGLEDWGGHKHKNTWVAQDFRFRWDLADATQVDPVKLTRILGMATPLYEDLRHLTVFCQSCSSHGKHTVRRWSRADDGYLSLLAFELRAADWVPAVRDGEPLDAPLAPASVWWAQSIPSGAALAQSPLRFLPLCDPAAAMSSRLRELVGIESLADASRDSILRLLRSVREEFDADVLAPDPGASGSARTAFGSLHRQAYERLANLAASDEEDGYGAADSGELLVLCEVGDALAYCKPAHAFHDNGSFASYRRYFGGIPFADISKEKGSVASYLGVTPFEVELDRRESGEPEDVTDEVSEFLADRVPEFLTILVYHVLAGQTLDPGKPEFAARARRLARLRVKRVDDLVIEARVKRSDAAVTIGEHLEDELFLEDPTTPNPVIYLDLNGDRWRESFRRRLGPLIARVLERPDYADIFTLFLLGDTDLDREATLLDRGIRTADVDKIRAAIGIVSEDEKRLHKRWFGAVIALLRGAETPADVAEEAVAAELTAAGLSQDQATRLIELGGGEQARRNAEPVGALSELRSLGLDLRSLDQMLKTAGDEGLRIGVARAELRDWLARHRRAAATVLSTRSNPPESAKGVADGWRAPAGLEFVLDPSPKEWLAPVVAALEEAGLDPRVEALATDPTNELLRLGGIDGEELERQTVALYDGDERRRILGAAAAVWRSQLKLLGVLAKTSPAEGRAAIRRHGDLVESLLPPNPSSPLDLKEGLAKLLPGHPSLAVAIAEQLGDSIAAPGADRTALLKLAEEHGVETAHWQAVVRAQDDVGPELARRIRKSIDDIEGLPVAVPEDLAAPTPRKPRKPGPRKIRTVKVNTSLNRRRRELGEQGEKWAVAAMIRELKDLPPDKRGDAIDALLDLFVPFKGEAPERARAHAEAARSPELDEDELIDELAGFLHVAGYSDAFGFDMLGWIVDPESGNGRPMLLEVKSSADGSFHLSPNEWLCAEEYTGAYGVLIVRRAPTGAVPQRLDLLVDPVGLVPERLSKTADGWLMAYTAASA